MQPDTTGSTVRVGLLVLAALAAAAFGIFMIGEQNNLFASKNQYMVRFETVAGLQAGNPVQLNGVDVGQVDDVRLPEDPGEDLLVVTIAVDRRYAERVRGDSRARIKTLGLLGDKYVEVTSGSANEAQIEDGGEIPTAEATDVDNLIASGEDVVENIVSISVSLKDILSRMEDGEGLLGELMRPREPGQPTVSETIAAVHDAVAAIGEGISTGRGPIARMLHDEALGDRLALSVERLSTILDSLENGDGPIPALLHDGEMRGRIDRTLDNLETASSKLGDVAANFEEGEGLLPKLLNDEELSRQITDDLQQLLERLNTAAAKLSEGDGTVAKLLDDPSVYDALNDVIVGVNESKFLRWLIRNRQKKGIKTRYDEAQAEAEATGTLPE